MWKVTIKGLLAHKLRFVLTGIAVILGIAFLSGTLVLTATIENTFDNLFTEIYEGTDVQVRGVEPDVSSFFGETPRAPVSDAVLETVRGVDGVAVASPSVDVSYAQIIGADGDPLGGTGPPTFGISYEENDDLNPLVLEPGSAPPDSDDQIVIDKGSADEGDLAVGDTVTVLTQQQPEQYELVGIATFRHRGQPARRHHRAVHAGRGAAHRRPARRPVQQHRRRRRIRCVAGRVGEAHWFGRVG